VSTLPANLTIGPIPIGTAMSLPVLAGRLFVIKTP